MDRENPLDSDPIRSPRYVAKWLGVSLTTIWRMRKRKEFPDPVRIAAGRVGWKESTLQKWLRGREAASREYYREQ